MESKVLFLIIFCLSGCARNKLTPELAKELLIKEGGYPKPYAYEVNRIDPLSALRLESVGLEKAGMVILKYTWPDSDAYKPKVIFTAKAKPYLMGPPKRETVEQSQNVKIADMTITHITGIALGPDDNTALVDYLICYTNITPFQVLIKRTLKDPQIYRAFFKLYNDGWHVESTNVEIMN